MKKEKENKTHLRFNRLLHAASFSSSENSSSSSPGSSSCILLASLPFSAFIWLTNTNLLRAGTWNTARPSRTRSGLSGYDEVKRTW